MQAYAITAATLLLATSAGAQSRIFGLNLPSNELYQTTTADFVAEYTMVGPTPNPIRALDFDADALVLWGIDNTTREYGTIATTTGVFTPLGTIGGTDGLTGLTAAVDGETWYVSTFDSVVGESSLYVGDITTGSFSLVGVICQETIIDIAIDSLDRLYGYAVSDDSLYSIDTLTGVGTLLGPLGIDVTGAQGMDFDWSDDTLYATLSGSVAGADHFAKLHVTDGHAQLLESTVPIGDNMEMSVRVPAFNPFPYCFGDGSGTPCPCGNAGAPTAGCANGSFPSGARLSAQGPWYAVGLKIEHGVPNQPVLFFEGKLALNGGDGFSFGDGLRCAGSGIVRLRTQAFDANGFVMLNGSVQDNGGGASAELRTYQGWYRDPVSGPCGSGFNLTNGVAFIYPLN